MGKTYAAVLFTKPNTTAYNAGYTESYMAITRTSPRSADQKSQGVSKKLVYVIQKT